jgi:hypothetical protein
MKVWPSFERAKVAGICQFQKGYLMYFDVICMTPADMFDKVQRLNLHESGVRSKSCGIFVLYTVHRQQNISLPVSQIVASRSGTRTADDPDQGASDPDRSECRQNFDSQPPHWQTKVVSFVAMSSDPPWRFH